MGWEVASERCRNFADSSHLEWLLPNGLGGFASGSVSGANTRRYHGHLVAAPIHPAARIVLLANIEASVMARGQKIELSTNQYVGAVHPEGYRHLSQFRVGDHAEWFFEHEGVRVVKRLKPHAGANAVTIAYQNLGELPIQLVLRPIVCHKFYHDNFRADEHYPNLIQYLDDQTICEHAEERLVLSHPGLERLPMTGWFYRFENTREAERGLDPLDDLFCPCELKATLLPQESVMVVASVGTAATAINFDDFPVNQDLMHQLNDAAKIFFVQGGGRSSLIAGYPWFSDWGRDTMIALPGLAEATGRWEDAKGILRSYAMSMHQGLIPNRFDDYGGPPDYNTVDATLWFAEAIHQVLVNHWESEFAHEALAWLEDASDWHHRGTLFGIQVDPEDGLLRQGEPGVQLTWMDAKVDDWVVTPRHGKPIEINGLWINFLRVLEWLCEKLGQDGLRHRLAAEKAESNFERTFWRESVGHYLDTADPDDAQLRPNQVIAMGLPFCPMLPENATRALARVREKLLTPFGLRTLGPDEPGYEPRFEGSMSQRDAAYHQGTVWPWLIGSYVAACLNVAQRQEWAEEAVADISTWIADYGLGGIAEVYDADPPQRPGACPWQAWSVAEAARAHFMITRAQK